MPIKHKSVDLRSLTVILSISQIFFISQVDLLVTAPCFWADRTKARISENNYVINSFKLAVSILIPGPIVVDIAILLI
jgi:hypothetical protein